jgi:hypothetical protein
MRKMLVVVVAIAALGIRTLLVMAKAVWVRDPAQVVRPEQPQINLYEQI